MLNIRVVQEYATDKVSGSARLIRETPYIRFRYSQEAPVFVQQGTFYYEDSTVIPVQDLPEWVIDSVAQLTPESLQSVGLNLRPQEPISAATVIGEGIVFGPENVPTYDPFPPVHGTLTPEEKQLVEDSGPILNTTDDPAPFDRSRMDETAPGLKMFASDWECPECGEHVGSKAKGLHIARHARRATYEVRHGNSSR